MKVIKCCKDCEYRHLGCHAVCEDYLAEKAELDAEREAIKEGRRNYSDIEGCEVARSHRAWKWMKKQR